MTARNLSSVVRVWLPRLLLLTAGFLVAMLMFGRGDAPAPPGETTGVETATVWTCSMHPQIRMPEPGKCPICFMDLIPETSSDGSDGPTTLSMSESSMLLAEIVTRPVRRQMVEAEVRTSGRVAVDERALKRITSWTSGRLDRLYVDYTGVSVRKGDHLVEIYSPELYSSQTELIESLRARDRLKSSKVDYLRSSTNATVEAAREKLRLLGFTPQQIKKVEDTGKASELVTIYAPIAGIVIHKAAVEGEYVKTGSPVYTIADLSSVWIMLDLYESDLPWIRYGQRVSFDVEAFPGETFEGRVAFIDPVVDPRTRTVRVRVNAANPGLRLKPDMFVRAVVRSALTSDGRTLDADLAGKWVSPMHPEIVKDKPGACDVCGMALVRAEELGFAGESDVEEAPLVIPATAPLLTGARAIVYVRKPDSDKPAFETREVNLGPRAGGFYIVESGLHEDEQVVVNGAFKIDSAMQIQAKPSMMNPEGGGPAPGHSHGAPPKTGTSPDPESSDHEGHDMPAGMSMDPLSVAPVSFRSSLEPLYEAYFGFTAALAEDDEHKGRSALDAIVHALDGVNSTDLAPEAEAAWSTIRDGIKAYAIADEEADLAGLRTSLGGISTTVAALSRSAGPPAGTMHHVIYCPMAFDNAGASWLQVDTQVANPYFGPAMARCGELKESYGNAGGSDQ